MEYCERPRAEAEKIAEKIFYQGFGPLLYRIGLVLWVEHLGVSDGTSVWTLLVTLRDEDGAVPKGFKIGDGFDRRK